MVNDLSWLDVTQIVLLVSACFACFIWGKVKGVEEAVEALIEEGHLDPKKFEQ